MNILFLTPQPIYQDRGSPIAVDLVLRVLSERGDHVDAVTYHEGQDIVYDYVNIHRIPTIPFIRDIQAGFSWKKIICDILMAFRIGSLILKNQYQMVHAVEEAVFFALLIKLFFKTPYIYDMDSSLAQQMVEQLPWLAPLTPVLEFFEGLGVKNAKAVVPVCDALADDIKKYSPQKVVILNDVSLLKEVDVEECQEDLRKQLNTDNPLLMYVGNLQTYQGIDLLLDSFSLALKKTGQMDLVLIGGAESDIAKYRNMSRHLRIDHKVHFLGPKPIEHLAMYLSQADILVSPRIKGRNTPMKIYSYLHSGKALLATDMATHTQVADSSVAMLADPSPEPFAEAMLRLVEDQELQLKFGEAGKNLIEEKYSYQAFRTTLNKLYDWLKVEIDHDQDTRPKTTSIFRKRYTSN